MSRNDESMNEKYKRLKKVYRGRPIAFFRNILRYKLSKQQQRIIVKAIRMNARIAVKSATGTGKTFLMAGMILHQLICEDDIKILATAPSAGQLTRGLKAEVKKLYSKMPDWLQDTLLVQTDQIVVNSIPSNFCSFVSADTDNQESLAGVHARKVIIINDEASALSDTAYDTLIGNLTTDGSGMIQISNPVRSEGKFRNLWKNPKMKGLWDLFTLDAFGSPFISKKWIEEIKQSYGEDSDMYRMRVLGEFPRIAEDIFFNSDSIESAMNNFLSPGAYQLHKKIMGVDVARFGSDKTVFVIRQGPMIVDYVEFSGLNTQEVAAEAMTYFNHHKATVICVDGIGVGAGVVDRLKELQLPTIDVVVNEKATDSRTYFNMRSQLYGEMKMWLENGACIPDSRELAEQLSSIRYGYNKKLQVQLISKIDLKKRYKVPSPDIVDAIMLTFYEAWASYNVPKSSIHKQKRQVKQANFAYVV